MTDAPSESPSQSRRLGGYALLAVAIAAAVGLTVYFLVSGGSGDAGQQAGAVPTPIADLPGAPTPVANTGVIDPNRPQQGERAPDFALPDVRAPGQVRKLSDFRGKPVVLNFWATWCGPCKAEIPEFQEAQDTLGEGVVFLGVNYRESPQKATDFLNGLNATFPSLVDGGGKVAEHYRVSGLPVTYFLDKDGVVVHIEIGSVSVDELETYLTEAGAPYTAPS
ncbi:MAG TPA: TlpA disulfide reductase family protein [Tepidiformaceae bacterium]|nr:TlpA disulfide reductase family protein [Tepidiformaceae bacterium]